MFLQTYFTVIIWWSSEKLEKITHSLSLELPNTVSLRSVVDVRQPQPLHFNGKNLMQSLDDAIPKVIIEILRTCVSEDLFGLITQQQW